MRSKDTHIVRNGKIAIVAGSFEFPRVLHSFDFLKKSFEVSVFIFEKENSLKEICQAFDVRLYRDVENMPGFMRGLENDLAEFDLIICLESSRLYSFQVLQAAKMYGSKLVVYSSETDPFQYIKFDNIRSMQKEIISYASLFLGPSKRCLNHLSFYEDVKNRFLILPQIIDKKRFNFTPNNSPAKFRDLLGWSAEDFVVLYYGDLNMEERPENIIEALKLMRLTHATPAQEVKVLFVGSGDFEKKLKYLAYDSGLGGSIYFMHQGFEDLLEDIYRASNVLVAVRSVSTTKVFKFPFWVQEAMACGVVPIVSAGSVLEELAGDACLPIENGSASALALALSSLILEAQKFASLRARCLEDVSRMQLDFFCEVEKKISEIKKIFLGHRLTGTMVDDFIRYLDDLDAPKKIVEIDRCLAEDNVNRDARGQLLCLRGEVYFQMGDVERSISSYESAIANDRKDPQPLVGLGYIAWNSQSDDEAETFFKKALFLDPSCQQSALGLGLVYYRKGRYLECLHWMTKSILDPASETNTAISCIAKVCLNHLEPKAAIESLESIIESVSDLPPLMIALGRLKLKIGDLTGHGLLNQYLLREENKA